MAGCRQVPNYVQELTKQGFGALRPQRQTRRLPLLPSPLPAEHHQGLSPLRSLLPTACRDGASASPSSASQGHQRPQCTNPAITPCSLLAPLATTDQPLLEASKAPPSWCPRMALPSQSLRPRSPSSSCALETPYIWLLRILHPQPLLHHCHSRIQLPSPDYVPSTGHPP